ncbi:MAG TPA: hypothetical protein PKM64_09905 [Thermoanaerobaculia bacterium]|nr:hypothetical protein [Thermoanaerobaculia bacterium]
MRDDRFLNDALVSLERPRASAGFTTRTLARLDAAPSRGPSVRRPLWVALAAALLLAAGLVSRAPWRVDEAALRREVLASEARAVAAELAALRAELDASRPAIPLTHPAGRPVEIDLVELERVAGELRAGTRRDTVPAVIPTSY